MKQSALATLIGISCILCAGCSIMDNNIGEPFGSTVNDVPVFASPSDSIRVFNAKSAIQRSSEQVLSGYVTIENGRFLLQISKDELEMLRVSPYDYERYKQKLSSLNSK